MFSFKLLFSVNSYITCLLALVAVVGDFLVSHTQLQVYRAIFDNTTHAVIGGLSWFLVCFHHRNRYASQTLFEVVFCCVLSSAIDLDHFVAVRSFHLKDALNLQSRPFLHCSSLALILSALLFVVGFYNKVKCIQRYSLMVFLCFASHHTRDATRRGYWMYPYGSTPPVPYYMYLTLTCFLPYYVMFALKYVNIGQYNSDTIVI